ncbi:hypothetical protein OHC33_000127 [Knufia fluminis]|uniref:Ribosomal protein/NADH dehydrogenase domain-containing protein n=1 Tax=Knufia fluminis TaxID=191047 RepID=A0AAN8EPQ7_9EURO|nr:hypothetical protein OHC33_000127 [Knufia fluminis]
MVNAAKRMRALTDKLFHIKNGAGSVVLPESSQALLKSIYMRVPTGPYPNKEYYWGGRDFWHGELKRLKYWNPTLRTEIETIRNRENEPMYLTVEYESTDREALSQLKAYPLPKPQLKVKPRANNKTEQQEQEQNLREQRSAADPDPRKAQPAAQPRSVVEGLGYHHLQKLTPSPKTLQPVKLTPEILSHAPSDEIKVKAQPVADASSPQTTSPPQTTYSRSLTIPLAGVRHTEIWNWIRQHTGLPDHRRIPAPEMAEWQKVADHNRQAAKDRKLVKTGIDAMKREQLELKKAREAAERMAAEAT